MSWQLWRAISCSEFGITGTVMISSNGPGTKLRQRTPPAICSCFSSCEYCFNEKCFQFGFGVLLCDEICWITCCSTASICCSSRIFCVVSSGAISVAEHILLVANDIVGTRDRETALAFDNPLQYLISKSNSCIARAICTICPPSSEQ